MSKSPPSVAFAAVRSERKDENDADNGDQAEFQGGPIRPLAEKDRSGRQQDEWCQGGDELGMRDAGARDGGEEDRDVRAEEQAGREHQFPGLTRWPWSPGPLPNHHHDHPPADNGADHAPERNNRAGGCRPFDRCRADRKTEDRQRDRDESNWTRTRRCSVHGDVATSRAGRAMRRPQPDRRQCRPRCDRVGP